MRALLLLSLVVLTGCGTRTWCDNNIDHPMPTIAIDGIGPVKVTHIEQGRDFLKIDFMLKNNSDAMVRFRPVKGDDARWGLAMIPGGAASGAEIRRATTIVEASMVVPAHQSFHFGARWVLTPAQAVYDWPWTIELHGLMDGERESPTVVFPMPTFIERPPNASPTRGRDQAY